MSNSINMLANHSDVTHNLSCGSPFLIGGVGKFIQMLQIRASQMFQRRNIVEPWFHSELSQATVWNSPSLGNLVEFSIEQVKLEASVGSSGKPIVAHILWLLNRTTQPKSLKDVERSLTWHEATPNQ